MDPYIQRPLTIHDLVLDPTLDTAPIAHAMPPRDRLLPGFAVIFSSSLLALLLLFAPLAFERPENPAQRLDSFGGHRMNLLLNEDPTPGFLNGGANGRSPKPGQGLGKEPNTPAQQEAPIAEVPPSAPTPNTLPSEAEYAPNGGSERPGGDGRPLASGYGDGRGVGGPGAGGTTLGATDKSFDRLLVPRSQPRAAYRLKPGENGDNSLVVVEVTVEDDGHVSQVQPLSGPEFLYPSVCEAARHWLFEPLGPHGLKGPMKTRIRFLCKLS